MVKWINVCRPKDLGGLGVLNSIVLNIALLTKWIWRLFSTEENQTPWKRIIQTKYNGLEGLFNANENGGS